MRKEAAAKALIRAITQLKELSRMWMAHYKPRVESVICVQKTWRRYRVRKQFLIYKRIIAA